MHNIEKIGQRFWYITPVSETDRPILGMVKGDLKTLMIDAGNSKVHAQIFINELSKQQVPKPDMVVLTHWHWDHTFGLSALSDTISISSGQTKKEMEKLVGLSWSDAALDERVKQGTEIEFCAKAIKAEYSNHRDITISLPQLTFKDQLEIDLGGVICIIQHVGGDHAADSVVVYIKEEKILFLGDCLYSDIFSAKRNYTIKETLQLLEQLDAFDADTYVLSHWKPISKEEYQYEASTLRAIANFTELFKGDKQKVIQEYGKQAGRELTEDELGTIEEFINGY
ncbi:MBL fold metallo-hydrolase [Neobacillus dielmonensis]|uniref:MBL fold metallo-hydrolase n=1 Tax=Neobacillus dielmonensis TaxID=1347369 RepID=UPI0005AA22C0|nr:MBL fold metallo-hydrolase [Neobacillus dielmonensis]